MLDRNLILEISRDYLKDTALFVVEVKVSKTNSITVTIDGDKGVVVEDCINLSKHIEKNLDRDKEDFELTVTSFGLEEWFSLPRQFVKNIGRQIELTDNDGEKAQGVLERCDNEGIVLTTAKNKEGDKISFDKIAKARVIINFNKKKK